jgi:hypothetical protein
LPCAQKHTPTDKISYLELALLDSTELGDGIAMKRSFYQIVQNLPQNFQPCGQASPTWQILHFTSKKNLATMQDP